jgi:hypothetical protein
MILQMLVHQANEMEFDQKNKEELRAAVSN